MKKFALLLLLLAPARAEAVEGWTILKGPDVPILESVDQDFPRYDIVAQCETAWPEKVPSVGTVRATCRAWQTRLAGLTSQVWNAVPMPARSECIRRAESAKVSGYYILHACASAAVFRVLNRDAADRVAALISRQNKKVSADPQTVGSIR